MGKLEQMKERYDGIPIPQELHTRVQQEIQKSRKKQEKNSAGHIDRPKRMIRGMEAAAAIACILFTAALNMSPIFI